MHAKSHILLYLLFLRESVLPILERRGLGIDCINVFVEASKTPLPLTCETFLLGGTTMYIKRKYLFL